MLAGLCAAVHAFHARDLVLCNLQPEHFAWVSSKQPGWRLLNCSWWVRKGVAARPSYTLQFAAPEVLIYPRDFHGSASRSAEMRLCPSGHFQTINWRRMVGLGSQSSWIGERSTLQWFNLLASSSTSQYQTAVSII